MKDKLILSSIESVAEKIAPLNPLNLYQQLFYNGDFSLYKENGNWEEQQQKLEYHREKAVAEILKAGGINSILQFSESVNADWVGHSLGRIADAETDHALLPLYLESENRKILSFINRYVSSRLCINGWSWVDELDKSGWSSEQISNFLSYLPFNNETWKRVVVWLGAAQGDYWQKTNINSFPLDDTVSIAIDKLIEYGRPIAAIDCLAMMQFNMQSIDIDICVKALLSAISSSEPSHLMTNLYHHNAIELIKMLQEIPGVNPDDLFQVEWAYLPWLDGHSGAVPKLLENRLASDPELFCEAIRLIYRSNKADATLNNPSEETKAFATNAWRLLNQWCITPGKQSDGSFNDTQFSDWLVRVKEICEESGHLDVALTQIGGVPIHSPPDPNGLWINGTVADALNAKDAAQMRSGFRTGILNSRGVYNVDPTGKPERELAEQYKQKAEAVENAGFHRLADTLRSIAESYIREAESHRDWM